jgi:hypothetical protein
VNGIIPIFMLTMQTLLVQSLYQDLKRAKEDPKIELHHVQISAFADLEFNDFDHIEQQFEAGKESMDVYLSAPQPDQVFALAPGEERHPIEEVAGMREFIPPSMR